MPHAVEHKLNDSDSTIEYGIMPYGEIISASRVNAEFLDNLRKSKRSFYSSSTVARASLAEGVINNIFTKLTLDVNKNRSDSQVLRHAVEEYAKNWITELFLEIRKMNLNWVEPHATVNSDGEIVFEWWYGTKKLTVYIGDQSAEYVQVWGRSVDSMISDGDAENINDCRSLWIWLVS